MFYAPALPEKHSVAKRAQEAREAKTKRVGGVLMDLLGDLPDADLVAKLQAAFGKLAEVVAAPVVEPATL